MFKENRLRGSAHANNVDGWTENFSAARCLSPSAIVKMRLLPEFRFIRRYLREPILDAGCGAGEWVEFIGKMGYAAHGVDYSDQLIARNRQRYPASQWIAADIRKLPMADHTYGGVISWGVIEHDEAGPQAALKEFHRVLKRGAHCIVTVPVDTELQKRVGLRGNEANEGDFFQYYFKPPELAKELTMAGFEVIHSGILPRKSIALAAPDLYFKYLGTRKFLLARLAALFQPMEKCAGMTVCIGRKSK